MKLDQKIFKAMAVLLVITAAMFVVNMATAQDSTGVITVTNPLNYFPAWVITLLQVLTTGVVGSYLSLLISKKLYNGKTKFIVTGLFLIAMGAGAAALAKIPLSNFPEFIAFAFSAAVAAYNLWIKKR
jgi:hypothetical protein